MTRRSIVALSLWLAAAGATAAALAPAADLDWSDFHRRPIGPRGTEPGERLLALSGQRVRIAGWPLSPGVGPAGRLLLVPRPVDAAHPGEDHADDLPPAWLLVLLPAGATGKVATPARGPLVVEGRLDVGARDEPDGRRSFVRLWADRTPQPVRAGDPARARAGTRTGTDASGLAAAPRSAPR